MNIRLIASSDISWIKQVFKSLNLKWIEGLFGFIAEENGRKVGLITYILTTPDVKGLNTSGVSTPECEIISINSLTPGQGIGTVLFEKVQQETKRMNCQKIIVTSNETTNDFFLKKGFVENNGILEKSLTD